MTSPSNAFIERPQPHHDRFSAISEQRTAARRECKYITPMRLGDLLLKMKRGHHDLTGSERATLGALITYVSRHGVEINAVYEAWPTIELIMERANLGRSTVEKCRKTLERKDWIKVQSGTKDGEANHYFINGCKIVEAYNASNPEEEVATTFNRFDAIRSEPSMHSRNTAGLKQGHRTGC